MCKIKGISTLKKRAFYMAVAVRCIKLHKKWVKTLKILRGGYRIFKVIIVKTANKTPIIQKRVTNLASGIPFF